MHTHVCEEHGDDVVVYHGIYGTKCPLCKATSDLEDAESKIESLDEEIGNLKDEISGLEETISDLKLDILAAGEASE